MILGLDYGTKNIGLAIADETDKVALPFAVIENKNRNFVLAELKKIIQEEKVAKLVVGLPVSLSGQEGPQARETRKFIDFLAKNLDVPIVALDERMSSRLADTLSGGTKGSRDIGSAMVILEDYLSYVL